MATQPPMVPGFFYGFWPWGQELAKAADYTILFADNGTLFTNLGATGTVVFTLPAIAANYRFGFYCLADYQVDIRVPTADLNKVVTLNNVTTADGVSFQTGSQILGGGVIFQSNAAGNLWYTFNMSAGTNTLTALTALS